MDATAFFKGIEGRRVAFCGIGRSHMPLMELFRSHRAIVSARDRRSFQELGENGQILRDLGVELILGKDYLHDLTEDIIFRTPGMRFHLPELEAARQRGQTVTSEMEVFFKLCPCKIYAVTGSDGKTTTTTIIAELLRAAGKTVHLGGNIGHPLLAETGGMEPEDIAVLELSSFQLMTMTHSPHIAVVTNLAPNHLDVHRDFAEYISAKENIFTHQKAEDIAVFNADNDVTLEESGRVPGRARLFSRQRELEDGVFLRDSAIVCRRGGVEREVLRLSGIKLPGVHNVENYMAAIAAVDGLVPDEIIRKFAAEFGGVEHRIELVRELNGVRYYNDSIASSPSRTIAGLRSFDQKIILIAGGKDKGIPYDALGPEVNEHVKLLILCGATAEVIRRAVERAENYSELEIAEVSDYQEAVSLAQSRAKEGDVVMLSPASTSFDRFANFMERGRVFKEIVNALK